MFNSKSGGQLGPKLLKPLRKIFGTDFVTELTGDWSVTMKGVFLRFALVEDLRVVVCGGDGTVQSVLNEIDHLVRESTMRYRPGVAILPLGTGNDLSRHFGK